MAAQFTNRRYGLDFGFSSDPAALVCTHYDTKNRTIYIYNEVYERGLTNDMLVQEIAPLVKSDIITADSAEPKSIAELRLYGLSVMPADKGRDSVWHGIQWLQQQRIIVDSRCINTRNELEQYKYKEDGNGNALRQLTDRDNHAIDALRYAYESEMKPQEEIKYLTQPANISRW
jgi:phage terminase large subunit